MPRGRADAGKRRHGGEGHRGRLRDRFLAGRAETLPDYELLELILFHAFPRGDTKPLAKDLITTFGSFAEVIAAPPERLREVKGGGDAAVAVLKSIEAAALHLSRRRLIGRPVMGSWQVVVEHSRAGMAFDANESFRVLFLDRKNGLIAEEVQQQGTVDHAPVYPREVVKRALELGATAIILVRNHPSGDATPSPADIAMTREVEAAAKTLGIAVHHHLVIGRDRHASFRGLGLI
ncbi:MAG: DNA repair protein RadC [Alphaproteobacteria bacterium]|nr:DNA repair protein RadC [Alphaproteobacteria bacterium]